MKLQLDSRGGRAVLTALLIFAAQSVRAQSTETEEGFYVGATAGVASYPSRPELIIWTTRLDTTDSDAHDLSWGLTGGYRFSRHFALEAGYVDLGEGSAHLIDFAGSPQQADVRFSVRGATLAGVLLFPIRNWEPYVKMGVLFQDVDMRLNGTQSGIPFALSSSADGIKFFWEAGVSYRFDERWKASFGLRYYLDVGDEGDTGEADLQSAFFGVTYRF